MSFIDIFGTMTHEDNGPPVRPQEDQMTKLIGFTGLSTSGKTTAAQVFVGRGYEAMSFAEPLKAMLATLLEFRGFVEAEPYLNGDKKEVETAAFMGRTPRHAMQALGTEYGRNLIHPDLWIDTFKRRVAQSVRVGIVVHDLRFQNEVNCIRDLGGKVYRIVRPDTKLMGHPSETEVANLQVHGEIKNDHASAEQFRQWVEHRFFVGGSSVYGNQ